MDLGTAIVWVALILVGLPIVVQLMIILLAAVGLGIAHLICEIKAFYRRRK